MIGSSPGGGIVKEDDAGAWRHGAGDRHAPPLPAGELRGHPVDELAEPDEAEHVFNPNADLIVRHPHLLGQTVSDVLGDGQ